MLRDFLCLTDNAGKFMHELIPSRCLRDEIPNYTPVDEHDDFLRFLKRMLAWLPEERATAKQLRDDPWLLRGITDETSGN